jgi:hypothetical protein
MSIFQYLQLQPVDPQDDGTTSDLDEFKPDEKIDLTADVSEQELDDLWNKVTKDLEKDPLTFSDANK